MTNGTLQGFKFIIIIVVTLTHASPNSSDCAIQCHCWTRDKPYHGLVEMTIVSLAQANTYNIRQYDTTSVELGNLHLFKCGYIDANSSIIDKFASWILFF